MFVCYGMFAYHRNNNHFFPQLVDSHEYYAGPSDPVTAADGTTASYLCWNSEAIAHGETTMNVDEEGSNVGNL